MSMPWFPEDIPAATDDLPGSPLPESGCAVTFAGRLPWESFLHHGREQVQSGRLSPGQPLPHWQ